MKTSRLFGFLLLYCPICGVHASRASKHQHGHQVKRDPMELLAEALPLWAWVESTTAAANDPNKGFARLGASLLLINSTSTARINVTSTLAEKDDAHSLRIKHKLTPRSYFAITFSFAFVVKTLCMLSNVLFQVSPFPQVRQFGKQHDTGEVDAAPFISILYCGCQWCFYGMLAFVVTKKSGFLVLVYSNVVGAILGIYYVWGFQYNCKNKQSLRKLFMYYRFVGTLAVLQAAAMMLLKRQRALFFCGLVSSVCSVVGACSLLTTLPDVLRTRCSASINLPLVTVGVGSASLWLICGILLWDPWITVPNIICLVCQLVAISVVFYFPRDPTEAARLSFPADAASAAAATETGDSEDEPLLPASPAGQAAGGSWSPLAYSRAAAAPHYGTPGVLGETGGTF